jgi:hypothetical protein
MRVRMNRAPAIAAAATMLALGACTSNREAPGPSTPASTATAPESSVADGQPRPCTLVTGAEAATALGLGTPLTPKTDTPEACEYQGANEVDAVSINVDTEAYHPGTEDMVVNMLGKDTARTVDGLGDAALSFNLSFQVQYHVWAKGRYLLIVLSTMKGGDLDGPARTIATNAVARL